MIESFADKETEKIAAGQMSRKLPLDLPNSFAETLRETLDQWPATQIEVARATGIPSPHLSDMKAGRRRCTPEYDLRLGRFFGTSPGFWMRLQLAWEMKVVQRTSGPRIAKEVRPGVAA